MSQPIYPTTEIDPQSVESKPDKKTGTKKASILRQLISTKQGRIILAAGFAIVLVVITLARRNEPAAEVEALVDTSATDEQLFSNGHQAPSLPNGGFDFQNLGLGAVTTNQPLQTVESEKLPEVQIVTVPEIQTVTVEVPIESTTPVQTVLPQNPVTPAPKLPNTQTAALGVVTATQKPINVAPKGYYRAKKGAIIYFENGAGVRTNAKLTAAQLEAIAGVEKKAASGQGQLFTINGITHVMDARDKGFMPKAAAGKVIN